MGFWPMVLKMGGVGMLLGRSISIIDLVFQARITFLMLACWG